MRRSVIYIGFCSLITLFSCDRTHNQPGFDYFPDMAYSKAYETNSENPNFSDSMTMREPVAGTIPIDMVPYPYTKTDEDRIKAGKELKNPLLPDSANLKRGKEAFEIFCIHCHGPKADGKGFLFTSGLYGYPPASLVNDKIRNVPDGEIYHVITVGYGVMGAHGSIIRPIDRWKIVLYIRELQKEENGNQE